jgi:hypothetical protein
MRSTLLHVAKVSSRPAVRPQSPRSKVAGWERRHFLHVPGSVHNNAEPIPKVKQQIAGGSRTTRSL